MAFVSFHKATFIRSKLVKESQQGKCLCYGYCVITSSWESTLNGWGLSCQWENEAYHNPLLCIYWLRLLFDLTKDMLDLDKSDSSLRSFSVPLDDFKMKPFWKCFSKQSFNFKGYATLAFAVYGICFMAFFQLFKEWRNVTFVRISPFCYFNFLFIIY